MTNCTKQHPDYYQSTMFAIKRPDGTFEDVFGSAMQVRLCGCKTPTSVLVKVDDYGAYWGWDDGKSLSMIWQSLKQLRACFPYGMGVAEARGDGKCVRLKITEINQPGDTTL